MTHSVVLVLDYGVSRSSLSQSSPSLITITFRRQPIYTAHRPPHQGDRCVLDARPRRCHNGERIHLILHHSSHENPSGETQERIKGANPSVVILSGGPNSVHVEGSPRVPEGFFEYCAEKEIAVLGICYGMQVSCSQSISSDELIQSLLIIAR